MKKLQVLMVSAFMLTALFVAGCSKDNAPDDQAPAGVSSEEQAMKYFAANDEFVANDEQTFADNSVENFDYGTFGKIDAAITPLRWGRFITSVTRTVTTTVQPGDTISIANVEKTIVGTLKIRGVVANGDTVTITKPFTDHSTRNIIFKRVDRNTKRFWLNWVPVATSLVDGGTVGQSSNINITMVQFFNANGDTITVTDPNNYYLRYRWLKLFNGGRKDVPELVAGQTIKLSVTLLSASADTDLVALRYGFGLGQHKRVRLALTSETKNADGTYTRVFEISRMSPQFVHFHRGFFHLGVDAVTKATFFDDAAPVAVSWWAIPYRVF